jgi:hypothetical protein
LYSSGENVDKTWKVLGDVGVLVAKGPVPKGRLICVSTLLVSERLTSHHLHVYLPFANNHTVLFAAVPEIPHIEARGDIGEDILLSLLDIRFQLECPPLESEPSTFSQRLTWLAFPQAGLNDRTAVLGAEGSDGGAGAATARVGMLASARTAVWITFILLMEPTNMFLGSSQRCTRGEKLLGGLTF